MLDHTTNSFLGDFLGATTRLVQSPVEHSPGVLGPANTILVAEKYGQIIEIIEMKKGGSQIRTMWQTKIAELLK
jgi:hypothetical protein